MSSTVVLHRSPDGTKATQGHTAVKKSQEACPFSPPQQSPGLMTSHTDPGRSRPYDFRNQNPSHSLEDAVRSSTTLILELKIHRIPCCHRSITIVQGSKGRNEPGHWFIIPCLWNSSWRSFFPSLDPRLAVAEGMPLISRHLIPILLCWKKNPLPFATVGRCSPMANPRVSCKIQKLKLTS